MKKKKTNQYQAKIYYTHKKHIEKNKKESWLLQMFHFK